MSERFYSRFPAFALILSFAVFVLPRAHAQSGAVLRGAVLDQDKAVIVNASVSLHSKYGTLQTKSDPTGRFEFVGLASGTYKLEVYHPGFQTATIQPIHIKREATILPPFTVTMEAATTGGCGDLSSVSYEERAPHAAPLVGAIEPVPPKSEPDLDWPYIPLSEATIEVLKVGSDKIVASRHPDIHGRFAFTALAAGEYILRAKYKGYEDARSVKFQITPDDVTKLTITMLAQGEVIVCM